MNRAIISTFISLVLLQITAIGQKNNVKQVIPMDSVYVENIKKSRLYGVYIPRDIDDALSKLMELTDEEARKPLKSITEDVMAKKLFFGLGRWMEYNWNFEEGSRFSHYLRLKGLFYTEDMTRFMLIIFHRHINKKPLEIDSLIKYMINERTKKIKEAQSKMQVVHPESIKKSNN